MRLSIVMIAKDDEAHVQRALESIVPQLGEDASLICVDDQSEDSTLSLMTEAAKAAGGRITVASTSGCPRGGVAVARNLGASMAEGDYLYHIDSDDWLIENSVKRMLAATEGGPDVIRVPHADQIGEDAFKVNLVEEKDIQSHAYAPPAPWARMVRRDKYVPFPECDIRLCLNPVWHFLQADVLDTYAAVEGGPCYVWDRTVPGAGTRTVEWSASNPRTLEQIVFTDELERRGLMKEWPADFLRSVAMMMDIGPKLKKEHVRAAWASRLGSELRNLATGRYMH